MVLASIKYDDEFEWSNDEIIEVKKSDYDRRGTEIWKGMAIGGGIVLTLFLIAGLFIS